MATNSTAPAAGCFKSTDGGSTWHPLTQRPAEGLVADLRGHRAQRFAAALCDSGDGRGETRRLPLGRCRRFMGADYERSASSGPHRRRRSSHSESRSKESRPALRGQHGHDALGRRRQNLVRISRRARRRRLPESLDQSQQRQHYSDRQRSGRDHHRERRRRAGVPGTTSPRRSSITRLRRTRFLTGVRRDSRRAARPAH